MGILDAYKELINASFSDWIKVKDKSSLWTVEAFPYDTGVDDETTYPHCWKCVTANECWFKNEENKKPQKFNYLIQLPGFLSKFSGLYHPNCHCKEIAIKNPTVDGISIIIPNGKEGYTASSKSGWIESMGYEDVDEFFKVFYAKCKESYASGDYKISGHFSYGIKIDLNVYIPKFNNSNKTYGIVASYMIFPKGKLKLNTHLGRWIK